MTIAPKDLRIKKLNKGFPISSVCRLDVAYELQRKNGLSMKKAKQEALKISDAAMEYLARKMGDVFCDIGYWEAIDVYLEKLEN